MHAFLVTEAVRYPRKGTNTVITLLRVLQAWRTGTKMGKIDERKRGKEECTISEEEIDIPTFAMAIALCFPDNHLLVAPKYNFSTIIILSMELIGSHASIFDDSFKRFHMLQPFVLYTFTVSHALTQKTFARIKYHQLSPLP